MTVDVAADKANDAAGNGNTTATQLSVTNDETVPTLTITSDAGDPQSGAFTATFTFSEDVTGFVVGDISVGNGAASNFNTTSASVYTATITPAADGAVTVDVAADMANDAAGNGNSAAAQLSVTNDETVPTVKITSDAGDPQSGAFTATFTFSEDVTGFVAGDISVGNGAASNFNTTSGSIYTATITPAADGAVTVDVAADKANDAAGNGNTAAAQLSVTNDETVPTVTITSDAEDPQSGAFTATFTFSEDVTGFVAGDISVGNGAASNFNTTSASVYTAIITPAADGAVTVGVAADKANDAAGNGNTTATQLTVTNDETAPTVTLVAASETAVNGAYSITATFSEDITGFELNDISVVNGIASDLEATSASTYTFTVSSSNSSATVSLAADVVNDLAGNGNTAADQLNLIFNISPTDITLSDNSIDENNAVGDVIGMLSTTDEDESDAHTYSLVSGTGDTDNASFTIDGNELKAAEAFDFETKSGYSIRVKTEDGNGGTFEKAFDISVLNVGEASIAVTTSVDFGTSALGVGVTEVLNIVNDGEISTEVSVVTTPAGFTVNSSTVTIPAGSSDNISVVFTPTEVRSYSGEIVLEYAGEQVTVNVTGEGTIVTAIDDDLIRAESIKVYPNPASSSVNIDLSELPGHSLDIEVVNPVGTAVFQRLGFKESVLKLDISDYNSGIYIVNLTDGKSLVRKKIMIKK